MDAWERMFEREAGDLAFLLAEEWENEMEQGFVKIGKRVINLANVTEMWYGETDSFHPCIVIAFAGDDRTYIKPDQPGYGDLAAWIERQPSIRLAE